MRNRALCGWRRCSAALGCMGFLNCLPADVAMAAAPTTAASIEIRDCWIRWLPANLPAGGYLTLINNTDASIELIAAASPDYADISIHRSRTHDGTAEMAPVASIAVAGHSKLVFASEGYHLMLMQPQRSLKVGDRVLINLKFTSGVAQAAAFELRAPDASDTSH
jgi:periplasmic copper chaperone A